MALGWNLAAFLLNLLDHAKTWIPENTEATLVLTSSLAVNQLALCHYAAQRGLDVPHAHWASA
jgi:hypothetical protein